MSREIERKFLLSNDDWPERTIGVPCVQGYISASPVCVLRVRIMGGQGTLTLKGPTHGIERAEYEYPVPVNDARELLDSFCIKPLIEKTRYTVFHKTHTWEIDIFHAANEGLVLAEIELDAADETFELPFWIGKEVSGCPEYRNSSLVRSPYTTWSH